MSPRCDQCRGGKVPTDGMRVHVVDIKRTPNMLLVLRCCNCRALLSKASLRALHEQRVTLVVYELVPDVMGEVPS